MQLKVSLKYDSNKLGDLSITLQLHLILSIVVYLLNTSQVAS